MPLNQSNSNYSVRRETGKEQMVEVRHDEGVANRTGPEPCVGVREGVGEVSVGERTDQLSSHESYISRVPAAYAFGENRGRVPMRCQVARCWG